MKNTLLVLMSLALALVLNVSLYGQTVWTEDFNGMTVGSRLGAATGWYPTASGGPVITTGGVNGTNGVGSSGDMFTWPAHQFVWSDPSFQKLVMQMDFKTSAGGHFDDDRLGWMDIPSTISSNEVFGVQMDPGGNGASGYNIEGYWINGTGTKVYPSIVNLPVLSANTWYRFRAEFTKLTNTSARIDVSLTLLDGSGNPTTEVAAGSIANTSALASGDIPANRYFSAASMYPGFKNHTDDPGDVDNAYVAFYSGPSIAVNAALVPFATPPGVPSPAQTYTVSGISLTSDITVTAPGGFELSTDDITYDSPLTLPHAGGAVPSTPIYVRLTGASGGTFTGDISHTSSGATTQNVAVTGLVALTESASLVVAGDTWLRQSQTTRNYGGSPVIQTSPNTTSRQNPLYQWDLSGIPAGSTIMTASLTFNVTDGSAFDLGLFCMRRAWIEGTFNDQTSTTSATWNTYDGVNSWGTAGARSTTLDRYDTDLWDATPTTFGATGSVTIPLNANGVSVVQQWVDGSLSNHGLTVQYVGGTNSNSDYWIVTSREDATEANRPKLHITYVAPTDPLITVSGTLAPFLTQGGVPSTAQTYTVSGINLTENILITPPTGYQLSADGLTYTPSLSLTQTGGTVPVQSVYVQLNSPTEGTFNGNITHTSGLAATKNLAVSGTVDNSITVSFQYVAGGYTGSTDAFIRDLANSGQNYGGTTPLEWDDNIDGTADEIALIRFNALFESEGGPIPDGSSITSATLTYRVSSASNSEGSSAWVHESLVDWLVGSVTWDNFGGDPGVQADEYNPTKVTDAPATALNTKYTIDVTSSLQRWSDGIANHGWVFLSSSTDGVMIYSNEYATVADRPLLTVEYEPVTGPYISAVAAVTPFAAQPNVPSAAQTYTVSGKNLTNDIAIAAPTGFELSTNGTDYGPALTVTPSGGTVPSTTVYVRLSSATNGSFAGNIVHTSGGATPRNVAVSGEVADGFAFRFGSGSGYITFGNNASLALAQFTLETWFKREGTGTTTNTGTGGMYAIPLVTKGRGEAEGSNVDMNYFLGIRATDNVLAADFEEAVGGPNDDGQNHPVFGTTPIVNSVWYHAAATFDGTAWKLYLNGNLEATLPTNGAQPRSDCIQHAGLGTAMNSTGVVEGHFDGVLDEVRIWNYARSLSEIRSTIEAEVTSAGGLVGRWGLNEGSGTTVQSTAEAINGTVTGSGCSWTAGSPMDVNFGPDQPALVAPLNASTGVSTSPTLQVTVTDPEAEALTVNFYGRPKASAGADFTIIALPDAQHYTSGGTMEKFTDQTEWCVAQKDVRNIVAIAMEGDITDDNLEWNWQNADLAMSILESPSPGIPYSISIGNHDQLSSNTTLYNNYFGISRFTGRSYYGGHYGSDNNNNYILFSASGMDFIMVFLGSGDQTPSTAVLDWADARLKEYSTRRAIVVSHSILTNTGTFAAPGTAIFNALSDNANLFLMLSGHVCYEALKTDTGINGNTIYSILSDYQDNNEGNGWLRILTFSPVNNRITVESYSPYLGQSNYGGASPYMLNYDMSGASFALLGTAAGVVSGSTASMSWPSLSNLAEYEWYVTVSDGNATVTGSTWSFTTEGEATGSETVTAAQPNTVYNFPTNGASMSFSTLPAGGGDVTITRHNATPPGGSSLPGGATFVPLWFEITSTLPSNGFSAAVTVDVAGIAGFSAQSNVLYYSTASGQWIAVGGTYNSGANTFTFTATHFTDFGFAVAPAGAFDLYLASSPTGTSSATFRPNAGWGGDYPDRENDWSFTGTQSQEVYVVPEVGSQFGSCDFTINWNDQVLRFVSADFTGSVFDGATTTVDTVGLHGGVRVTASLPGNVGPIMSGQYVARIVLEVIKPGSSGLTVTECSFLNESTSTSIFVTANDALHGAYLADVFGADETAGDGKVDYDDLVDWSYAYWSGVTGYAHGTTYYKAKYDIGPTADGYVFSLPTKDEKIDFEDLVVFAISYNISTRHQIAKPGVLPTEPMDVSTGQPAIAAGQTVVPVVLSGTVTDLRALSLELTGRYGKLLGVETGSMLNSRKTAPIIMSTQANGRLLVDFALPASQEPSINTAGELLRLTFEGSANVGVSSARARDPFNRTLPIVAKGAEKGLPTIFALDQNYPNPFNPSTMVSYQLPAVSQVTIKIYDVIGREVATLVNEVQEAGYYTVQWNGRSDAGAGLSSGLYFCRMRAGDFSALNKMLFVK